MTELPRGTVTFLFTDIEGSTRLLKRLGGRYDEVLEVHRRILRAAAAEHDGREVDTQGDSFFFAFPRAGGAIAAAVAGQRGLAAHEWPEDGEVRVRMGLHTGEPIVGDERYVGIGVHRAARIGAAGHGGQVLLSSATRELVDDETAGVEVRELGLYRLKDIDRPERLFQLDVDGLETGFPALKAEKVSERRPVRRRALLLSALAGVIAAAVAIPIFAFGQGGGGEPTIAAAAGDSVGFVNPRTGHLVADTGVGATPSHIAVGEGAIWVTNNDGGSVSRIDPATNRTVDAIPVGNGPSGITVCNGAVWVANGGDGTVQRINPDLNRPVQTTPVGNGPQGMACADGWVWVANTGDGTITRIDAATGSATVPLPVAATELAVGDGAVWASQHDLNRVVRLDPKTGAQVDTVGVGNGPTGIAVGDGGVWVANSLDGTVSRINPDTNSVAATVAGVGDGPNGVVTDERGVWVSNEFDGKLARIDPKRNQVADRSDVGNRPQGVATSAGSVLVAVRHSGAGHRGGTLVLRSDRPVKGDVVDFIDPALSYSTGTWPLLRMTGDGLTAFDQVSGLPGTQLVPDLATSLPTPTDGGRTYTFRLRPGIRYSTGKPVEGSDFRSTLERDYRVANQVDQVGGFEVAYYDEIVGGARCRKLPKQCDLSQGIVADDAARTVTFHLVAPDPDFLYKLALPFAYVLPGDTPRRQAGTHPLPATGPYMIATYRPRKLLRLVRNPYFREWSRAAQPTGYPDRIDLRIAGTTGDATRDVTGGKADVLYTSQPLTTPQMSRLQVQYASELHSNPSPGTQALFLNTRVPPFDRLDVRRALNYAVDRAAATNAWGGPDVAEPTCQIVPPNFPGYRPYCPYTAGSTTHGRWSAPDLARATALVARSGTRGMQVTVWAWSHAQGHNAVAVKLLRSLGYRVTTKPVRADINAYYGAIQDSRNRAPIGFFGWQTDYPAASAFLAQLFSCKAFRPDDVNSQNISEFCDPAVDRQMRRAEDEQLTDPAASRALWQRVDREVTDRALWVPLFTPKQVDFLAKRVGNYQFSPAGMGMLIDQLWVR